MQSLDLIHVFLIPLEKNGIPYFITGSDKHIQDIKQMLPQVESLLNLDFLLKEYWFKIQY